MCRIPKVVIVAPEDRIADLRRALSSIEYDVVASEDGADVAVIWEPDEALVARLRDAGLKTVSIGGASSGAEMALEPGDVGSFKTRVWELFRPR
jgi:hypothetical protein